MFTLYLAQIDGQAVTQMRFDGFTLALEGDHRGALEEFSEEDTTRALSGVMTYFFRHYDKAHHSGDHLNSQGRIWDAMCQVLGVDMMAFHHAVSTGVFVLPPSRMLTVVAGYYMDLFDIGVITMIRTKKLMLCHALGRYYRDKGVPFTLLTGTSWGIHTDIGERFFGNRSDDPTELDWPEFNLVFPYSQLPELDRWFCEEFWRIHV